MANRKYSDEVKSLCKQFFIKGWSIQEISKEMNVEQRTLYHWKKSQKWQDSVAADSVEIAIAKRINILSERENKTAEEVNELGKLCETFGNLKVQLATADSIKTGTSALVPGHLDYEGDSERPKKSPAKRKSKGAQKREKKTKNDISTISEEDLDAVLDKVFFDYQKEWYARKNDPLTCRNRFILKSRQIGATYYFAFEALDDAIRTGDNQIFLSASRDQAEVFKAYIIAFAFEHFGVELKGTGVINLSNGAELRFLSTNSRTAQSYHGHLYFDEVFWVPDFAKMWKVASAMSAHKKWRRTLFSTPSVTSHQAYPMWSGEKFNQGKKEKDQVKFNIDVKSKALKNGILGPDKIWRHAVTVVDAENQGCDLFDIEELKAEYSKDDFLNLFMCIFINDAQSVFKMQDLLDCMAEITGYNEKAPRPYHNLPVAIGYDPSRSRDPSSLVLLAIPLRAGEKWKVLKTDAFKGQNFQFQANRIKEIVDTHNVKYIGIDTTGLGLGVFELIQQFYSRATPIFYSHETKTELVLKLIQVVDGKLIEFQAGDNQMIQSIMMISKTTSSNGTIIYSANRTAETGHADKAWATMHALHYEPIAPRKKTTVTFSD